MYSEVGAPAIGKNMQSLFNFFDSSMMKDVFPYPGQADLMILKFFDFSWRNFLYSIYWASLFTMRFFLMKLLFKYWYNVSISELVTKQSFKDILSLSFLCYSIFLIMNSWFLLDNFSGRIMTYSLVSSRMAVSMNVLMSKVVVSSTQIKILVISRFLILLGSSYMIPLIKSLSFSLIKTDFM